MDCIDAFRELVAEGRDGFTMDREGREYSPPKGFGVACGTHTTVEGALAVLQPHQYLGWWRDPETGEGHIEVVDIYYNAIRAVLIAHQRGERCIYDFEKDKVIYL